VSSLTVILLCVLLVLLAAGVAAAAMDLSRVGSKALDLRRARRASKRGWDWPAFERELASYTARTRGRWRAAHRRH
jgi:hypothetical protein